ncbi:ABC transporter ATP-binding protein [Thalassotalea ponticola]|uniref:ABC transporter ATP-binding protein n=1 Tax=Thalassotalea ponticola TaxID=1523392 RepID=UPI0025B5A99A|nr:ABC transporter ATP-binding protein [Thalassotalea ponticola]MDN3652341.1 ABC transporter ATP-binding protein [Thalassotalea ponticola]
MPTMPVTPTPLIELNNIDKTYLVGEQPLNVLKHVSLTINQGEYVSIMGPSGSGKSTLLNMMGLLDRPDSGSVHIDGIETRTLPEEERAALRRDNIGFIFQNFQLIRRLTAEENAALPMMLAGMPIKERKKRVAELFAQLGIEHRLHHLPKQLSGGELQRVAIARAMVMQPKILLADEPTGNLDQHSGKDVIDVLETLNNSGITLLVVTHDIALGKRATRQLAMVDGVITQDSRLPGQRND